MTAVSIIIPTYNRAGTLARSVGSVLAEGDVSGIEVEAVVVDDGSTDETAEVLERLNETYPSRLRVLHTAGRTGANAARNLGVRDASHDLVAFNDSDDVWLPGRLAAQVSALRRASAGASVCGFLRFVPGRDSVRYVSAGGGDRTLGHADVRRLLVNPFVTTQGILVHRDELIRIGGFDESMPRFQDWELSIRLCTSMSVVSLDRPGALLYDTAGSITHDFAAGIDARRRMLEKHADLYREQGCERAFRRALLLRRIWAQIGLAG